MLNTRALRIGLLASMGAALLTSGALAQGIGLSPPPPTQFETTNPASQFVVVDPNGTPIPIERDPLGPPWTKNFTGPNGGPFTAFGGVPIPVTEFLTVAGNLPWLDWHERILTPGWSWTNNAVLLANNLPAPGLTISNIPGTTVQGGILDFYFNALPPGTQVEIRKELIWNGLPGQQFIGTLQIEQYPTPEPASLALLASGGLVLMRRRRIAN